MLEQVLAYLNNWFQIGIYPGEYTVTEEGIFLPFLQDGQYYRIIGSMFNDGLHRYHIPAENEPEPDEAEESAQTDTESETLHDETFNGAIWALAIPPAVIGLADEITAWMEKNKEVIESPYSSESFGGYSYTKSVADGSGADWRAVFGNRMKRWKRLGGIV